MLKLALIGPPGAGKSTAATALAVRAGPAARVVKLADPLYLLQRAVWKAAGRDAWTGQDRDLMGDLARHMRRINPRALVDPLLAEVAWLEARGTCPLVVCDDLRDPDVDAPALRAAGFRIVAVRAWDGHRAARLGARGDASGALAEPASARIGEIPIDGDLHNAERSAEAWGDYAAMTIGAALAYWSRGGSSALEGSPTALARFHGGVPC